jgi:hypothetical protein
MNRLLKSINILIILVFVIFSQISCSTTNYEDCVWRPGEDTKCKMTDDPEWRPYYMEEMSICSDKKKQSQEESKWAWSYPTVTDLYLFAELIDGVSKEATDNILLENGYVNCDSKDADMLKKEKVIRGLFKKLNKNYEFIAIKQHRIFFKQWLPENELKGRTIWLTTYWRCIDGPDKGNLGSLEFCINLDTGRCSKMSDYWDSSGKGWCRPDLKGKWNSVHQEKPWNGSPLSFPILEIYNALR